MGDRRPELGGKLEFLPRQIGDSRDARPASHKHCAPGKPTLDYDATEVLRSFTRKCALDVVHLWEAPPVVKRYLRTGDPKLRVAARATAKAAAGAASGAAAWNAAWATARAAARAAAWAAGGAARDAAWATAGAIARATAGDTAMTAAGVATKARQSRRLARMLQVGARRSR